MQRVSIGRALVREPLDLPDGRAALARSTPSSAPTSASSSSASRPTPARPSLYVTHDQIEAMTMATHVGVLDQRPPGAVRHARARSTRTRSRSTPRAASASRASTSCPPTSSPAPPPAPRTIGLRPEQIRQGEGEASTVARVERLGDQTRLHLSLPRPRARHRDRRRTPRSGPATPCRSSRANPFYFDAAGARLT